MSATQTQNGIDTVAALAAELGISRHRLGNLLMAALDDIDQVAAGLASRYGLPLEPVEDALEILAALSERKAAMDAARVAALESDAPAGMQAATGRYRALANLLEMLAQEM